MEKQTREPTQRSQYTGVIQLSDMDALHECCRTYVYLPDGPRSDATLPSFEVRVPPCTCLPHVDSRAKVEKDP